MRAEAKTLHPTALLCEKLVQQASEGGEGINSRTGEAEEASIASLRARRSGTVLTIPGNLVLSAGSWLKLPLRLVETVCGFLRVRPMASIEWLLLRITRYKRDEEEEIHSDGADPCDPPASLL